MDSLRNALEAISCTWVALSQRSRWEFYNASAAFNLEIVTSFGIVKWYRYINYAF